jgi:hypothetical protein
VTGSLVCSQAFEHVDARHIRQPVLHEHDGWAMLPRQPHREPAAVRLEHGKTGVVEQLGDQFPD